jgi:hypothetical protein
MVTQVLVVTLVTLVLGGTGCGSTMSAPAHPTASATPEAVTAEDPSCPVLVAGTSVAVEDTDQGAALVFVTTGDVAAVRARAKALAEQHNARHARMTTSQHAHHHAAGGTMGEMISSHSTAAVAEIPNGARVTFTAEDAAAIQAELRMHAKHLANGTCVM